MECLNPITKKDKFGIQHVPCGTCLFCKSKNRKDWSFRLWQEHKHSKTSKFITLTYSNENIRESVDTETGELLETLFKPDVQNFIKRLRKENNKQWSNQIRYYLCGEYGDTTNRPHYHLILFNCHPQTLETIPKVWGLGHVHIGTCNVKAIAYTTKYVMKSPTKEYPPFIQQPFALMSRRPFLGHQYLKSMETFHKQNNNYKTIDQNGHKTEIPRIYKDKIFTKNEQRIIKQIQRPIRDKYLLDKERKLKKLHKLRLAQMEVEIIENKIRKNNNNNKLDKL